MDKSDTMHSLRDKIEVLKKVTSDHFSQRKDLESFLTLIKKLGDDEERNLLHSKYDELCKITLEELDCINRSAQNFMKEKLENLDRNSADYLYPLQALISEIPLEIFTLNYDGIIELFCENCGLNYSDGFSPFWSSDVFDNDKINVKIYRLHGSLYWFKISSGKMMRIPIRGLKLNEVRYISGSCFNEMIIYPTLEKEKYSELYSYLSNKFITKLNQCTFCIVVGYSWDLFTRMVLNHLPRICR